MRSRIQEVTTLLQSHVKMLFGIVNTIISYLAYAI